MEKLLMNEKLPSREAIAKAAQAWCTPNTKNIEMDMELCIAFAHILDELNVFNQLETIKND